MNLEQDRWEEAGAGDVYRSNKTIRRMVDLTDNDLVHICRALDRYATMLNENLPEPENATQQDYENVRVVMEMDDLRLRLQGLLSGDMLAKVKRA